MSKRQGGANVAEDMEKRETSCTVGRNVNWYSHCGKQYGDFSIKPKTDLPYDPAIPLVGIYPKQKQKH